MFTGIIEEIGTVHSVSHFGGGRRIAVKAKKALSDLKIDDSISLNGACQTVVTIKNDIFEIEAVEETIRKTTLGKFKPGMKINLERALRLGSRLGGHLVQGHVDCTGKVDSIRAESAGKLLWVKFPPEYSKYIVPIGSICIDGVSLTIARNEAQRLMVSIIPHTWNATTLCELHSGSEVNLEFDIIGKYVENLIGPYGSNPKEAGKSFLEQFIDQPE